MPLDLHLEFQSLLIPTLKLYVILGNGMIGYRGGGRSPEVTKIF